VISLYSKESFLNGEDLFFVAKTDTNTTLNVLIYSINRDKYVVYDFSNNVWTESTSPSFTTYSTTSSYKDEGTERFLIVRAPKTFFSKPDFVKIKVENTSDSTDFQEKIIIYGEALPLEAEKINVYGQLFDAYGNPLVGESVVFSVVNETTYYDNSLYSSMNAFTSTDANGRFSIYLNRRYNYVLTLPRLAYSKLLKIKDVPSSVNAVEVSFNPAAC
jgi:uncharacterized GH25 family protein